MGAQSENWGLFVFGLFVLLVFLVLLSRLFVLVFFGIVGLILRAGFRNAHCHLPFAIAPQHTAATPLPIEPRSAAVTSPYFYDIRVLCC